MSDPSSRNPSLHDRVSTSMKAATLEVCTRHSDMMISQQKRDVLINIPRKIMKENPTQGINLRIEALKITYNKNYI
ncbi:MULTISPECIES: hypothetical protein [unclassified Gluconobacter]|uniref:hypothetical protein n=1 Tax=unclassified Gluconobacter TaxID=2644261 RepID=UPI001C03CE7E|nr:MULTISPECIES: hypothetical protein [unclassified Gluconobacter]